MQFLLASPIILFSSSTASKLVSSFSPFLIWSLTTDPIILKPMEPGAAEPSDERLMGSSGMKDSTMNSHILNKSSIFATWKEIPRSLKMSPFFSSSDMVQINPTPTQIYMFLLSSIQAYFKWETATAVMCYGTKECWDIFFMPNSISMIKPRSWACPCQQKKSPHY